MAYFNGNKILFFPSGSGGVLATYPLTIETNNCSVIVTNADGEVVTDTIVHGMGYNFTFTPNEECEIVSAVVNNKVYGTELGNLAIENGNGVGMFIATGDTFLGCYCNAFYDYAANVTIDNGGLLVVKTTSGTGIYPVTHTPTATFSRILVKGTEYDVTFTANEGYTKSGEEWVTLTDSEGNAIPYTKIAETENGATYRFTATGYTLATANIVEATTAYNNITVRADRDTSDYSYYRVNEGNWVEITGNTTGYVVNDVEKLEVYGANDDGGCFIVYDSSGNKIYTSNGLDNSADYPSDVTPYLQDGCVVVVEASS